DEPLTLDLGLSTHWTLDFGRATDLGPWTLDRHQIWASASTMETRDARRAGKYDATTMVAIIANRPAAYASGQKRTLIGSPWVAQGGGGRMIPEAFRTARIASARTIPATQPTAASAIPSTRNIRRIPAGRVPRARSVPISRVLSETAIVMTIAAERMTMTTST